MASDRRMFEHANEDKFWEIWADGKDVYTRFGKRGAKGQTKIKAAPDPAAAIATMIAAKRKDGFEQTGGEVDRGPALDAKQLERHLKSIANLDDAAAIDVLADWLQQQAHPWGELIALQRGGKTKQADAVLAQHAPAIAGEARGRLAWKHGFVQRAVVRYDAGDKADAAKAVKALLALPAARFVEELVIAPVRESFATIPSWERSDQNLVEPWGDLDKIAKVVPARITRVGFGEWPGSAAAAYTVMPAFAKVSAAFPDLTHLELAGVCAAKPGKLASKVLVSLAVRFARANAPQLAALAGAKLPKLARLRVWLGGESRVMVDDVYNPEDYDPDNEDAPRYPAKFSATDLEKMGSWGQRPDVRGTLDAGEVARFLADKAWSGVTDFGIQAPYPLGADVVAAIAQSPLVKRATTLDLSGGPLDDDGAAALIAAKKALAHLASIDLRGTAITKPVAKKLAAALPNAVLDGGAPVDYHFRFVATME